MHLEYMKLTCAGLLITELGRVMPDSKSSECNDASTTQIHAFSDMYKCLSDVVEYCIC